MDSCVCWTPSGCASACREWFLPRQSPPRVRKVTSHYCQKKRGFYISLSLSFLDLLCFFLHFKAHSYRSARPSEDDYLRLAMNSEESVERFSFAADGGVTLGGC